MLTRNPEIRANVKLLGYGKDMNRKNMVSVTSVSSPDFPERRLPPYIRFR